MLDQLLSLLMSFILMILSIFGGTGDINKGDDSESDENIVADYSYTVHDDYIAFENVQYGKDEVRNTLDLYIPRTNTKSTMGVVVFIHGGGWILGDKSAYTVSARDYARENGYACASINYSYLSEDTDMNAILDDITDALTAIKHAGEQVAVTLDKTVMVGHSAGGHLALLYSYSMAEVAPIQPAGVVSYAGPTDLTAEEYWTTATDIKDNYYDAVTDGSGRNALSYILSTAIGQKVNDYDDVQEYAEELLAVSPVNYTKTAVPTILVHGKKDVTVPYENATALDTLLSAASVSHKLVTLDNAGHDLAQDFTYIGELASRYLTDVKSEMDDAKPFEFTYLEYPAEAVKTVAANGVSVSTLTARADKNDADVYKACQGYSDVNGVVISPYYTAAIEGTDIPVYAATTYIGATGKGALHSFSEIYVTEEMAEHTFEIEFRGRSLNLSNAVYMTTNEKITANAADGKVTAKLAGYGMYTFLFNNEAQEYAYTLFVREEVDEDAEIAELRAQGYNVEVYSGVVDFNANTILYYDISGSNNRVIYLRKGTYITATNKQDISSDSGLYSEGSGLAGIGGLTRYPLIGGSGVTNVKILGYGTIDFTELDRAERKGIVFSWGSNVEIRGIRLVNSAEWALQTYRINGLKLKDVSVFGYRLNSDAFDICNSQNVTVEGCFARSGDDLFAVKTLGGEDATSCYSTNIEIKDCVAWASKARAFGISGEANLPIDNVKFKNCAVICHDATWAEYEIAAIGIMVSDVSQRANTISNVTFEDIRIYRNDSAAFSCYVREDAGYGVTMSNITFKNIYYNSNVVKSKLYSTKSGTSINATLDNVYCGTTKIGSNYAVYINTTSNVNLATY